MLLCRPHAMLPAACCADVGTAALTRAWGSTAGACQTHPRSPYAASHSQCGWVTPAARPGAPPSPAQVRSPAVCEEAAADVSRAVASGRGTRHALRLDRLPGELGAIEVPVLLSLGRQGAPGRAAVGRVLPGDVALAVTPRDGTSGGRRMRHTLLSCHHLPGGLYSSQGSLTGRKSRSVDARKETGNSHYRAPPGGRWALCSWAGPAALGGPEGTLGAESHVGVP